MSQLPLDYAFKEWAVVCQALVTGRQQILIRKGGISEENGLFCPEHSRFWLLRTKFHQSETQIRPEHHDLLSQLKPPSLNDQLELTEWVEVTHVDWLDCATDLESILPQTIYTAEVLSQRFHYRQPGLYVLQVRVHSVQPAVSLNGPSDWEGCKTWVQLTR